MLEFYQIMQQELARGPVVLATVARVRGSVPREVGAKMLVCADGRSLGTIGGGAGEAKVQRAAQAVLQTGQNQFVEIDLSGARPYDTQGVCGGRMQVWLERWSGETALVLVQQIQTALLTGQAIALVTPFDGGSPYLCPTDALPATATALIEPLIPAPTLLIVGAGHVAVPLAQLAALIGFQVVVVDDRPEFACGERFPAAWKILPQPLAAALDRLGSLANVYVALVTRGYQQDLIALRLLLGQPLAYLGMIGSQKRIQTIYQILQTDGYVASDLAAIHAPIGLDIGALTPEEIAVSICAQLIQVRRSQPSSRAGGS